jgi:2-C-methyl-D-erythritol 4-phosphate cytidylyltransferase
MNNGLPRPVTAVVVVAAGSGERLGYGMPKARVPLGSDAILTHALRGVAASGVARQILISELALAEKTDEEKAASVLDEVLAS